MKLRNLSQRYPILFSILFLLSFSVILLGTTIVIDLLFPRTELQIVCSQIYQILFPIGLVLLTGYGFTLKEKGFGKAFLVGLPLFLVYAYEVIMQIVGVHSVDAQMAPVSTMLIGILTLIGIGIREEFIYRGVASNVLTLHCARTAKGLWIAVILSGLLFGFPHMTNLLYGITFSGVMLQCICSCGFGIVATAIYLRGGNVWALALVHAVIDLAGYYPNFFLITNLTDIDVVNSVTLLDVITLPLIEIAVAIFLLRKSKHPEIFNRLDARRAKLERQ